jgi:DNA-binding CsgD family transcriptional regulator
MMEHLNLLIMVAALAAGLAAVALSALLAQYRQTPFFRCYLVSMLLFNLLILVGMVLRFVLLMLQEQELVIPQPFFLGLLALLALLKLSWLYAFVAMSRTLSNTAVKSSSPMLLPAAIVALLLYLGALVSAGASGWPSVDLVSFILEVLVFSTAIAASALPLQRAWRSPAGQVRSSRVVFGVFHLGVFLTMLASFAVAWLRATGPSSLHLVLNSLFLIFYNLFLLGWMVRYQPAGPGSLKGSVVVEGYGITRREREIIELICAGKTNQEIADQLFISLATVKDHNHNIFRKTGVRNRVELANLFQVELRG